jgi:protein-tyrosine-phosphatase
MSKAMEKINKDGEKIVLDIYSTNTPDDKTLEYLNKNGCHFHGRVSKEEVEALQKASDIVVFVESLEKQKQADSAAQKTEDNQEDYEKMCQQIRAELIEELKNCEDTKHSPEK